MGFTESFSTSAAESIGLTFVYPEFKVGTCGLNREDSVTLLLADRSELIILWTMKYRDDRIISLGYGDRK